MIFPATRFVAIWMLRMENRPVELITFAFLLAGGIRGLALVWWMRNIGKVGVVFCFFTVYSVGLLIIGMEEVAWGQWFIGFETPLFFKKINAQGELTFHNIHVLQGHSEYFRVAFGLGGLVGVWLSFLRYFRKIGVPVILLPWFLIIILLAGVDLYNDYYPIERNFDYVIDILSELVEMLIAISGFLYIWLNAKTLTVEWKKSCMVKASAYFVGK